MFILADNIAKTIMNLGGYVSHPGITTQEAIDAFEIKIIAKYAIKLSLPPSQLEFYWVIEDPTPGSDLVRIMGGDEFSLVWSGTNVTGIDFGVEEAKGWLTFLAGAPKIKGDGVDNVNITFYVYQSDQATIDNTVNVTKLVPIGTPQGVKKAKMTVVNGQAVLNFKRYEGLPYGRYTFPARNKHLWGYRVWQFAEIEVYFEI